MMKLFYVLSVVITILLISCDGSLLPFSATLNIRDSQGVPIPGLAVFYKESEESKGWNFVGKSDSSGEIRFSTVSYNNQNYQFKIVDLDGYENFGNFKTTYIDLEDDLQSIILEHY